MSVSIVLICPAVRR